jgi:hypothetical protein
MIDDLDEALRQLFIRELPVRNNEIDIAFDLPKREWSARLNRPTLNVFLHDVKENVEMRHVQARYQDNGRSVASRQQPPLRMDMHYMVTAWATEPEDEHRLLSRALMALYRTSYLPEDILPEGLRDQGTPIYLKVAQYDSILRPSDIWTVLDNELRPAISCMVTLAINPFQPFTVPLVRTRELRFARLENLSYRKQPVSTLSIKPPRPPLSDLSAGAIREPDRDFWTVGGNLHTGVSLAQVQLRLVETGVDVPVAADGSFVIGNLQAGEYTLEILVEGTEPVRHVVVVPSEEYNLEA